MNVTALDGMPEIGSSQMNTVTSTARLSSAAKEFESVLLGQWLKDAESSFGNVPGSEEGDAGGEQMKEFAMQHVATEFTNRGGIGIAAMVERALEGCERSQVDKTERASASPEVIP